MRNKMRKIKMQETLIKSQNETSPNTEKNNNISAACPLIPITHWVTNFAEHTKDAEESTLYKNSLKCIQVKKWTLQAEDMFLTTLN